MPFASSLNPGCCGCQGDCSHRVVLAGPCPARTTNSNYLGWGNFYKLKSLTTRGVTTPNPTIPVTLDPDGPNALTVTGANSLLTYGPDVATEYDDYPCDGSTLAPGLPTLATAKYSLNFAVRSVVAYTVGQPDPANPGGHVGPGQGEPVPAADPTGMICPIGWYNESGVYQYGTFNYSVTIEGVTVDATNQGQIASTQFSFVVPFQGPARDCIGTATVTFPAGTYVTIFSGNYGVLANAVTYTFDFCVTFCWGPEQAGANGSGFVDTLAVDPTAINCPGGSGTSSAAMARSHRVGRPLARRPPTGRPRVGVLAPILYPGGAESWLLALARSTANRLDWAGCVVAGPHANDPAVEAAVRALMPLGAGFEDARALAGDCDVLIAWAIEDLGAVLRDLTRRPKVISAVHAPPGDPWGDAVYARHEGVDHWGAVSELALEALPPASRAAAPASVIWNAVDPPRLEVRRDRREMRRSWGVPDDALVVGFYGRLSPEKDPLALARALGSLPAAWHAVAIGRGPLAAELRALGLDRLHVADSDPAAGDVLSAFDVVLNPSRYESFGLTMAEAAWLGVPVVATDAGIAQLIPGIARMVPIGATGPELAAAVLAAHAGGPMPGSQATARERFDPNRFGREWAELVERLAQPTDADLLAAVRACPERGTSAPASELVDCGCQGKELTICRAGKGTRPGRVTLAECIACRRGQTREDDLTDG